MPVFCSHDNIKTNKKSCLTSFQHHELYCLADVIFYRRLTVFQCYLSAIMHELKNSLFMQLVSTFADVYFKDVSAPLESICYLGPHARYIKENEIKQARQKGRKKRKKKKRKKKQLGQIQNAQLTLLCACRL